MDEQVLKEQVNEIIVKSGYDFSVLTLDYVVQVLGENFQPTATTLRVIVDELQRGLVRSHTLKGAMAQNIIAK